MLRRADLAAVDDLADVAAIAQQIGKGAAAERNSSDRPPGRQLAPLSHDAFGVQVLQQPAEALNWLLATAGGQFLAVLMLARVPLALAPAPDSHAYAAASAVLAAYAVIHCIVGAGIAVFLWARIGAGFVSARRSLDVRVGSLWQDYAAATGALVLIFLHALPAVTK